MELLPLLCALGVCSSLALGNDVKAFAPEDLDGSGDDEDYSGSGIEGFLDYDTKDENVFSTPVTLLVPTVTQMSTALQPDVPVDEESELEHTTKDMETKKPHKIEDIFAVQETSIEEGTTLKATTQQPFIVGTTLKHTTQQSFAVESDGVKKHHHHHHPHHHTTTPVTTSEDSFAVDPVVEEPSAEVATTINPTPQQPSTVESVDNLEKKHHHHHHHHSRHHTTTPAEFDMDSGTEVAKPFVVPEEPTASVPDEEFEVNEVAQNVTQMPEYSVHQETSSGSSSTPYADATTAFQPDIDNFPVFGDSEEETTVADETDSEQGHHHHPYHTTTVTPLNGSGIIEGAENDELKPKTDHDQHEKTTKMSPEDRHDHHHHHHPPHHHHHHTTTASANPSTGPEKDLVVPTHESKGRRVNVPLAETTAAVPVKEDEQMPESLEPVDSSEGPSGDVEDFFIDNTVPVVQQDKIEPVPEDGSSDASHGILDRKELLAGIIAGGVAGLVFAAALVAFVFYRMKKKDEGSYSLEEPKQSNGGYQKPREQREFYA